jgi:periplasmic protein CpxP/Spy
MNKKTILVAFTVLFSIGVFAQDGGGQGRGFGGPRMTINERVAMMHKKFDSAYHYDAAVQTKIDSAFATQYRAQEAARPAFTPGVQIDQETRDKWMERNKEIAAERDETLQGLMKEADYKNWKEILEPSLRPQRGQGGGRPQGGGQ